jgi:uncharacterized linocin/CFP29 family protein
MPEIAALDRLSAEAVKGLPLPDLNQEIVRRAERMEHLFEKGGDNYDLSEAEAAEIKALNDELTELNKTREQKGEYQALRDQNVQRIKEQTQPVRSFPFPGAAASVGQPATPQVIQAKSLGQLFVEHEEFLAAKGLTRRRVAVEFPNIDLKTVMSTDAGWAPQSLRSARVADLIPQDPTDQAAVVYMEETTFTNAADTVAEKGTKPEAALAYTQRSVTVEVIAVNIPLTRQQMDDIPQVRATVDNRLLLMLQLAEEDQLLNGNGTSPDLVGFYNKSGIQTQAKGADPTPDAIFKAFTKVRHTGFAEPTAVVLHPNDWQDIRLLRTADGIYIWGSPAEAGPERIWGKPVVATTAATENTALTGDFQLFAHISRRMGARVEMSTEHSDYFVKNQVLLQAEERLSLEIYRAAAFCTVTGI